MKPRLVVGPVLPDAVAERATREFDTILLQAGDMMSSEAIEALQRHRAEAFLVPPSFPMDAGMISRCPPTLKVAALCTVGFDNVDLAAAKARDIAVTNTPEVETDATAELAFMLVLCACRRAAEYLSVMRDGWKRSIAFNELLGEQVSGRTIGIVGMGRIGRAVAARARGFSMRVIYHERQRLPRELESDAQYFGDFLAMLPHCQVLSLHMPASPQTSAIMNAQTFALLPQGAVFVNAARGGLVDEDALIAALTSGHLFAAGLDVFQHEPAFDRRLAALPNVFLTPHIGSGTQETREAMGFLALDNAAAVCEGRPALNPVPPP
jgi:lactate dehydrogenase-like 2-hydroxyacid dehydrogenase